MSTPCHLSRASLQFRPRCGRMPSKNSRRAYITQFPSPPSHIFVRAESDTNRSNAVAEIRSDYTKLYQLSARIMVSTIQNEDPTTRETANTVATQLGERFNQIADRRAAESPTTCNATFEDLMNTPFRPQTMTSLHAARLRKSAFDKPSSARRRSRGISAVDKSF